MNFDFYLFGTPDGYDQYPLDDKEILFQSFYDKNCPIQLSLYRNAELVYYINYRCLNKNDNAYFGMSVVFNGAYPSNLSDVFDVFNTLFVTILNRGKVLKRGSNGQLVYGTSRFTDMPDEIESIMRDCRALVEKQLSNSKKLLPAEYVVQDRMASFAYDTEYLPTPLEELLKNYNRIDFTKEKQKNSSKTTIVRHRPNNRRWLYPLAVLALATCGYVFYQFKIKAPLPVEQEEPGNDPGAVQKTFRITSGILSGKAYEYDGELNQDGLPDGEGKAIFDDATKYIGSFKNGELNGYGELEFVSGDWEGRFYKGFFKDNDMDTGMLISGSLVYQGSFRDMEYLNGILVHNEKDTMYVNEGKY